MIPPRNPDELAAQLERVCLATTPDAAQRQVLAIVEPWAKQPGGVAEMVERCAASPHPAVARTVAFFLARAISFRQLLTPAGPLVLRFVEHLAVDDPWARINLLTAIQLASMYRELLPPDEPPPRSLMRFLIDCADRNEDVQSALAAVVAELRARTLSKAPPDDVATLRTRMRAIKPEPGSLLEMELSDVASFLAEADQPAAPTLDAASPGASMVFPERLYNLIAGYFSDQSLAEGAREMALACEDNEHLHRDYVALLQWGIDAAARGDVAILDLLERAYMVRPESLAAARAELESVRAEFERAYQLELET
ncbi:MAG: hypothetical protein IT370_19180 [Deltaproteobacteria bacterium]|nr:hypothetical protein [Deltaproteobacteria bacterium]